MLLVWLLLIFILCTIISLAFCGLARVLFPKFRSGEHKPGTHRADLLAGGREIKTIELPLVGGPAFTLAIVCTGVFAGYLLHFTHDQWTLLLLGLGTTAGYMIVGFVDDWHKVYSKEGLSERTKFGGLFLVSMAAAALYFFLLASGRESYSPYKDIPVLGSLLCPTHTVQLTCAVSSGVSYFGWLIFLMLMTGFTGTITSLSVDFSDGLDGLAGGLVFSTAIAFAIIVIGIINGEHSGGLVLEVLSLLCAASVLGYLPWNWPSAWAARRGTAKRRAKIYMGDSGALALGGILAMIAIFSRQELLLFLVGGAFVLEGLSALVSARVMTPFFRKRLQLLRFVSSKEFVPHTEFPLPFLATPLHHHFDLLGWDRRRLVYAAWALGACFALLGVSTTIAPFVWQRYLGRILILILGWGVWSSGSWSKRYFVGKYPFEKTRRRRRLALYYGYPYQLMGINLFHRVEVIEANEDVIETPAEELALWQRMNIYDARAMLGLYCYRAGYFPAALAQWMSIPNRNRVLRPEIARLSNEVENRLALEKQETQPMRRDEILRQPPILEGNLPPADLPNPYEPIHRDENLDNDPPDNWPLPAASFSATEEEEDARNPTAKLQSNHHKGEGNGEASASEPAHQFLVLGTSSTQVQSSTAHTTRSNWLTRLLRPSTKK